MIALAFSGMTFLAPEAEAGGRRSYRGNHGYHDNYRYNRHYSHRHYYARPRYHHYYAPVVYGGGYYDNCYPRYRHYSRPRIAVSFGF